MVSLSLRLSLSNCKVLILMRLAIGSRQAFQIYRPATSVYRLLTPAHRLLLTYTTTTY